MSLEQLLAPITLVLILLSSVWLLPIILFMRLTLTKEGYVGIYRAWLLAILSLIIVASALIVEVFYGADHHLLHYPALILYIWASVVVAKNTASEYILLRTTKELERQVEEKTKRIKALYDASQVLNAELSMKSLLSLFLGYARDLTGARYAALGIIGPGGDYGEFIHLGLTGVVVKKIGALPKGRGIVGLVMREKRPVRIDDITRHPMAYGFPPHHPVMRTFLGVPVMGSKGDVLGILYMTEKRDGTPFTEEDERLIVTFATTTASAIERVRLLENIIKAKGEWEKTFDSIDEMIVITDREGNILRANKAVASWLNIPIQEVIGLPCYRIVYPEGHAKRGGESGPEGCPIKEVVKTKEPVSIGVDVPHKDRSLWVTSCPFDLDERGEVSTIINIFADITHLKRITMLEEEKKGLEEMNRFKGQLIALVSHELRNPLTSIHGFIDLLSTRQVDEETRKRWIGIIHEEAERMERLTNEVLNLSSIEAGRFEIRKEAFPMEEVLEKVMEPFKYRSALHQVELEVAKGLPMAYGDREEIGYVVSNLLDNAIRYSPEGGRVLCKAEERDSQILVSVRDEGVGIPPEEREKVFEPFYRIEKREIMGVKGIGIGLSICKTIVELHGGRIWTEGGPDGKGSVFYFTIPVKD